MMVITKNRLLVVFVHCLIVSGITYGILRQEKNHYIELFERAEILKGEVVGYRKQLKDGRIGDNCEINFKVEKSASDRVFTDFESISFCELLASGSIKQDSIKLYRSLDHPSKIGLFSVLDRRAHESDSPLIIISLSFGALFGIFLGAISMMLWERLRKQV